MPATVSGHVSITCLSSNAEKFAGKHSPNEIEPSVPNSPNTSTGGARRSRGFQPTEVNIGTPPKAPAAKAVQPKPNPVNVGPLTKPGENGSLSMQLTNPEETPEHKASVDDVASPEVLETMEAAANTYG